MMNTVNEMTKLVWGHLALCKFKGNIFTPLDVEITTKPFSFRGHVSVINQQGDSSTKFASDKWKYCALNNQIAASLNDFRLRDNEITISSCN